MGHAVARDPRRSARRCRFSRPAVARAAHLCRREQTSRDNVNTRRESARGERVEGGAELTQARDEEVATVPTAADDTGAWHSPVGSASLRGPATCVGRSPCWTARSLRDRRGIRVGSDSDPSTKRDHDPSRIRGNPSRIDSDSCTDPTRAASDRAFASESELDPCLPAIPLPADATWVGQVMVPRREPRVGRLA